MEGGGVGGRFIVECMVLGRGVGKGAWVVVVVSRRFVQLTERFGRGTDNEGGAERGACWDMKALGVRMEWMNTGCERG